MTTINKEEIQKFSNLANEWWDPKGKFKPLHMFNPIRIEYISEKIKDHFRIVPRIFSEKIVNQISKRGKLVKKNFEYVSNLNNDWFSKKEIDNIINSNI